MSRLISLRAAALAAVAGLGIASVAQAEIIFGMTGASAGVNLVNFDSATPGAVTTVGALSGVVAGHGMRSIDFRPFNGQLYGISTNGVDAAQVYTIDTATGVATPAGVGFTLTGMSGTRVSMDFNPAADRLRIVGANGTTGVTGNYRFNPNTNAFVLQDTNLAYAAGDVNEPLGNPPFVIGTAYDRNDNDPLTATTMYTFDFNNDDLSTTGSINGVPNSPNTGLMNTIGGPPGFLTNTGGVGFDISGVTGTAYLSYDTFAAPIGTEVLDTMDLATGLTTRIGGFQTGINMLDISAAPIPEPTTLGLAGVAAMGLLRRRRA